MQRRRLSGINAALMRGGKLSRASILILDNQRKNADNVVTSHLYNNGTKGKYKNCNRSNVGVNMIELRPKQILAFMVRREPKREKYIYREELIGKKVKAYGSIPARAGIISCLDWIGVDLDEINAAGLKRRVKMARKFGRVGVEKTAKGEHVKIYGAYSNHFEVRKILGDDVARWDADRLRAANGLIFNVLFDAKTQYTLFKANKLKSGRTQKTYNRKRCHHR